MYWSISNRNVFFCFFRSFARHLNLIMFRFVFLIISLCKPVIVFVSKTTMHNHHLCLFWFDFHFSSMTSLLNLIANCAKWNQHRISVFFLSIKIRLNYAHFQIWRHFRACSQWIKCVYVCCSAWATRSLVPLSWLVTIRLCVNRHTFTFTFFVFFVSLSSRHFSFVVRLDWIIFSSHRPWFELSFKMSQPQSATTPVLLLMLDRKMTTLISFTRLITVAFTFFFVVPIFDGYSQYRYVT